MKIPCGVEEINDSWKEVYKDYSTINTILLPDTIRIIGKNAFSDCINLKDINFPNGLTTIKESAFFGCKKIRTIVLPSSVKTIENYAFYESNELTTLTIPFDVKVDTYSFPQSLQKIILGDSQNKGCIFSNFTINCFKDNKPSLSIKTLQDNQSDYYLSIKDINNIYFPIKTNKNTESNNFFFSSVIIKEDSNFIIKLGNNNNNKLYNTIFLDNIVLKDGNEINIDPLNNNINIITNGFQLENLVYIKCNISCEISNEKLELNSVSIKASRLIINKSNNSIYNFDSLIFFGDIVNGHNSKLSIYNENAIVKINKEIKLLGELGHIGERIIKNTRLICGGSTNETRGYCIDIGYDEYKQYPSGGDCINELLPFVGRAGGVIEMKVDTLDLISGFINVSGKDGQYQPLLDFDNELSGGGAGGIVYIKANIILLNNDPKKISINANGGGIEQCDSISNLIGYPPVAGSGIIKLEVKNQPKKNLIETNITFSSEPGCCNGKCGERSYVKINGNIMNPKCNNFTKLSADLRKCVLNSTSITLISISIVLLLSICITISIIYIKKNKGRKKLLHNLLAKNDEDNGFSSFINILKSGNEIKRDNFVQTIISFANKNNIPILSKKDLNSISMKLITTGNQGAIYKSKIIGCNKQMCTKQYKRNTLSNKKNKFIDKSVLSEILSMVLFSSCKFTLNLFSIYVDNDSVLLNTEWCSGGSLEEVSNIISKLYHKKIITVKQFSLFHVHWAKQLATSISIMHKHQIVHRDIKPANVMFLNKINYPTSNQKNDIKWIMDSEIRLIDFGISRYYSEALSSIHHHSLTFTPIFAPPEVLTTGEYTKKSDEYSFACTLAICLEGEKIIFPCQKLNDLHHFIIKNNMPFERLPKTNYFNSYPGFSKIFLSSFTPESRRPTIDDILVSLEKLEKSILE